MGVGDIFTWLDFLTKNLLKQNAIDEKNDIRDVGSIADLVLVLLVHLI